MIVPHRSTLFPGCFRDSPAAWIRYDPVKKSSGVTTSRSHEKLGRSVGRLKTNTWVHVEVLLTSWDIVDMFINVYHDPGWFES